jgi:nitrous oxidase accessory protein
VLPLLLAVAVGCPGSAEASLAAALLTARAGDEIEVCGVQRGSFDVPAGVAVIGSDGAVLDGGGTGDVVRLHGTARLENVRVRGDGGRLDRDDAAVRLEGEGGVVRRVRVEARAFGVYLKQASGAEVSDCDISGDAAVPQASRGNGIHLWNSRANRIERCRVHGTRDGIYLSFAHHNLITGNLVSGVRFGLHDMYSDDNRIVANRFDDDVAGAALMFSKRNVVERNACEGNRRYGLLLKDVDTTVVRGNVLARDGNALFVQQSNDNEFAANRIQDAVIGVHLGAGAAGNLFHENLFAHNVQQVLVHGAKDNRWDDGARGNYWSDYTGTDEDGDGIGDVAYRAGDLAGYLADQYPLVRVLEAGPAYDAVRFAERVFPVIDYPGAVDHRPLLHPPAGAP